MRQRWTIERLVDGQPALPEEHVQLRFGWAPGSRSLRVAVSAPFHGDPAPNAPAGPTDRLWEHEVVELFLLSEPAHYLEIELGPHGHHLVIELEGRRRPVRTKLLIRYRARIEGARWAGHAELPAAYLPANVRRGNGYAIHGRGAQRRYLAYYAVPGRKPDFHRLQHFGPLD